MGRRGRGDAERPGQRGQSPGETAAPSPWEQKDGGAPRGAMDWAFLPVGAAGLGGGCSWHAFAAAKLCVAVGDGLAWSHPSPARAAPAEPGKGRELRSSEDARDALASPSWGKFGLFLLSSPFLQAQPAGAGFSPQNLPPGLSPDGDLGEPGSSPAAGGTHGGSTAAPRRRVGAGGCDCQAVRRHTEVFLIVLEEKPQLSSPFYLYSSLKTFRIPPQSSWKTGLLVTAFGCQIIGFFPLFPF